MFAQGLMANLTVLSLYKWYPVLILFTLLLTVELWISVQKYTELDYIHTLCTRIFLQIEQAIQWDLGAVFQWLVIPCTVPLSSDVLYPVLILCFSDFWYPVLILFSLFLNCVYIFLLHICDLRPTSPITFRYFNCL